MYINQLVIRRASVSINMAGKLGRGLFANKFVPKGNIIMAATPMASWLSSKSNIRLDRTCNHCFRGLTLGPCARCEDDEAVMSQLKPFHKTLKDIFKKEPPSWNLEPLVFKLAHQVCVESRLGYENTQFVLNFMMAPDTTEENKLALEENHDRLTHALRSIGFDKEVSDAIDIDWYCRTLGVLFLHNIETGHLSSLSALKGLALYDSLSFVNHSCRPNVRFTMGVSSGLEVAVVAAEDIEDGEELLVDYRTLRTGAGDGAGVEDEERTAVEGTGVVGGDDLSQQFLRESYGFDCIESCRCGAMMEGSTTL
jgi:hypothetical protein